MEVPQLRLPADAERREHLRDRNQPRLLLIDDDQSPPEVLDVLEDWVRLPASDDDIAARLHKLEVLASSNHELPYLDAHGLLWMGAKWQSVPPVEAALTSALIDNLGTVVSRERLAQAAWPGEESARNALDVRILRLRRRIAPLGLVVRTVRSQGYLLEVAKVPA